MSDEESVPRGSRRGRPPASASKATVEKKTPASRSRSTKKETEKTGSKSRKEEEKPGPIDSSSEEDEVGPSTGRRKKEEMKEAAPVVVPAESDDDLKVVKTVKARPNFKAKAPIKKEVEDPEEEEVDVVGLEPPTSSKSPARSRKKKKAPESTIKLTRSDRTAGGSERAESAVGEDEEMEEHRESRASSRSTRKGKTDVVEEKKAKEKRIAPTQSTKKGRKVTVEDDDEEDDDEEQSDKRSVSRSTRKSKKAAESDEEEEEEEEEEDKRKTARSSRQDKKTTADKAGKDKRTASRSTSKGKKAVDSDEEEEEDEEEEGSEAPKRWEDMNFSDIEVDDEPVKDKRPASRSTRKGKKAVDSDDEEEEEDEEPEKNKKTAARSTRKGRKVVGSEEEEEEEDEEMKSPKKKTKVTRAEQDGDEGSSRSRSRRIIDFDEKKGKKTDEPKAKGKKAIESDEEEEEEEPPKKDKRIASRSTRKGKKPTESDEEEEEEPPKKDKRPASRTTRRGKKDDSDDEEEEEEQPKKGKRTAPRSTRKGKKAVHSDEEEEEEEEPPKKDKRTASRSTRKGKKTVDSDEEEEEEEDEEPEKANKTAARSTRKGRKLVESEEEEEMESPKKKVKATVAAKEQEQDEGSSQSRSRRRIDFDDEKGKKKDEPKAKGKKTLRPIETPKKKTQEQRKQERDARRAERGDDDVEIIEEDVKPLIRFKPEFVNDLEREASKRSSSEHDRSSDDEITITGAVGVPAATDAMTKETTAACRAIVTHIRVALRSVFISKDDRAFKNAVFAIVKAQHMSYERDDYELTSRTFYDEIEYQLTNMMIKDEKETKSDTEGKQRVLKVIAKAAMTDFEVIEENQYAYYWNQINFLLNRFATAADAHIRAVFCSWVSSLLTYSKECHQEELGKLSIDELEEMHSQRLKDARDSMTDEDREVWGDMDMDRRLIDGHMLKLVERKRLYSALYTSLKHDDVAVRIAAIKGLSVIQDDPIPPAFEEAVRHSPKDLIMRQLADVHMNVRKVAIDELRPKTDEQIQCLLNTAMQEKHLPVRIAAFAQLGRLKIIQFNKTQRHSLLAMLRDNVLGKTIEQKLLHSWLYEMVTGENPRPMAFPVEKRDSEESGSAKKKSAKTKKQNLAENWSTAPFQMLAYLDCIDHKEDVLEVLKKGSSIARRECGLAEYPISRWVSQLIDDSAKHELSLISQTEYKHLLDRNTDDESRATIVTYWLHCLQFVHQNSRDEGDRYQGVNDLSPSMGILHGLIIDLLEDEKERRAPRKKMIQKGDIDVTHPACIPTAPSLQAVIALFLSAFRYLNHGDAAATKEWYTLLMTLIRGDHCDLSPAMWEVIMNDLLKYHCRESDRDDLMFEMSNIMGFDFDDAVRTGGDKSPKRHSKSPAKKGATKDAASTPTSSHGRKEGNEKRMEERRMVIARPDCLGMIHGALKTAYFNSTSDSFSIIFRAEMDAYRTISDNRLQAVCLECIGMFGPFSAEMSERYIGFVMENLTKPPLVDDDSQSDDGGMKDEEKRRRRKKIERVDQEDLEIEYQRRMKEERERKDAEERSRRGGRNHCVGMALAVITDLIVAHSMSKVEKWLEAASNEEKKYSALGLFGEFEALVHDQDLELAFKVAHSTCKLALHDRELMRHLNRTAAKLQFRALHPSSFAHSRYRSCVVDFFKLFGQKSSANQMAMVEMVITMLKMLKDRPYDCRNIIDRGNAAHAVAVIVWSCAPSSLKQTTNGVRPTNTAHGSMLAKLKLFLEKCEEDARDEMPVDMDYYKAILGAVGGSQFFNQKASLLREIYNLLYTNADLLDQWDKGGEAKKMAQKITKIMDKHLDCVNEIIRLNKTIGVVLADDEVRLPFEDEEETIIDELREKAREMGKDLREVSPVKDGRASRAGGYGKTPATKKRGPDRGLMSTLKKEPAKSRSYAAQVAAERKEAAAAAATSSTSINQATPSRTRAHLSRKRPNKMPTIVDEESDSE